MTYVFKNKSCSVIIVRSFMFSIYFELSKEFGSLLHHIWGRKEDFLQNYLLFMAPKPKHLRGSLLEIQTDSFAQPIKLFQKRIERNFNGMQCVNNIETTRACINLTKLSFSKLFELSLKVSGFKKEGKCVNYLKE